MSRPSQIDLTTLLEQQNPQIDLRIQAYETTTRNFLKAVTNFKNKAIALIIERRNAQATEIKRATEKIQVVEAETNQCKLKELEMLATVEKEQEERKDAELSTNTLKRQLASSKDHCSAVSLEIEQYRTVTGNLRRERDEERELLDFRALQAATELDNCQKSLQCVIEGIDKDQLLVRFTHIDPSDLDREFSLVLDVSDRTYKVIVSTPMLPTLPILLDELNQTRDVYCFIKHVRQAFVEVAEIK